jgi:hypothetical protein
MCLGVPGWMFARIGKGLTCFSGKRAEFGTGNGLIDSGRICVDFGPIR